MSAEEEDTTGPQPEPLAGIDRRTFLQATGATALIPAGLTVTEEQAHAATGGEGTVWSARG